MTAPIFISADPLFLELHGSGISKHEAGLRIFEYYQAFLNAQDRKNFLGSDAKLSETYWQACLYQNRFGSRWITEDGKVVEILNFGRWNREEGPDFVGALIKFGEQLPVKGDLELDRDVRDWERHHHAQGAAYRNVLVHFFFEKPAAYVAFTRNFDGKQITQVHLDLSQMQISPPILQSPIFFRVSNIMELIEAAARFRMLRKQQAFRQRIALSGFSDALFRAVAAALGYHPNSLPFDLLARRVGVQAAASPQGEALLFGVAGFLRGEEFMQGSQKAKKYLRNLWDLWWPYQDQFSQKQLSSQLWQRTSVRPFNYPERRLGALVLIARQFSLLQELIQTQNHGAFLDFMRSLYHPFWYNHSSFFSRPQRGCLLLGEERSLDLLINVFYPAQDFEDPVIWNRFRSIRLPTIPKKISETLSIFIGEGRLPQARLKEAVIQQGLLQIASHFNQADALANHTLEQPIFRKHAGP